jgi:uncharacterized protein YdaU (DUF1376 family)
MAKDPAFLFYPSDFLTGTMFMNHEQVGIYVRLLCSQHQHGGMIDKVSFNALVKDDVLIKGKFVETEIGFFNERLAEEMELRCKKSTNISEAVKEVWRKRKELNGIPSESKKKPKAVSKGIEDEDVIKDIIIPSETEFFEYCKTIKEFPFSEYEYSIKSKYESWVANGWKDGNNTKIKNWKTKIKNTLPHLKPIKAESKKQTTAPDYQAFING